MEALISRYWRHAFIIATLAACAVACISALHRVPWSDEGWFSSASYNLANHGFLGTTVIEPASTGLTRIDERTYWVMPLFLLGQAWWLKIVPPTLFGVRLFTLLWAPVAVWSLYCFLARLFPSRSTAILAAGLLATSYVFVDNASFGRPDMACAALGLAALASYASLRDRSLPLAMLAANSCIAASGMMHPNAIFHALALAAVMVWMDGRRVFRIPVLAAATLPYLITAAAWGWYISLDPAAFRAQMHANGTNGRWTATWNPAAIVWNEIRDRYLVAYGFATRGVSLLKAPAILAYLASLGWICFDRRLRSSSPVKLLLLLLAIYFIAMSIFNQKLSYYLVHIIPVYVSLLAICLSALWERHTRLRVAIVAGVVVLTGLETGGVLLKAMVRSYRAEQKAMVAAVRAKAGPASRICGSASLIYEFDFDIRLKDDPYLGTTPGGAMPDIVIVEPLYRDVYAAWKTERPGDMKRIQERLDSYRRIYERAGYEVFLRHSETAGVRPGIAGWRGR